MNHQVGDGAMAIVSYDGTVLWIPMAKLTVKAVQRWFMDGTRGSYYDAVFKFASWAFDGNDMDLGFFDDLEEFDVTEFLESSAYKIIEKSAVKNIKYYSCCPEPYPSLTFTLKFK